MTCLGDRRIKAECQKCGRAYTYTPTECRICGSMAFKVRGA